MSAMGAQSEFRLEAESRPTYSFSGHQTFPFRYAWLPKGVQGVARDSELFWRNEALTTLGVGKNMVDSIRHWCEATRLIESDSRASRSRVLPLGKFLFGSGRSVRGVDPFLEDPATLWLLHWQLTARPMPASTWYLAFTKWGRTTFTREQLAKWIFGVARQSTASRSSQASIKRDVDVFLRTYAPNRVDRRRPLEDSFDCPLAELGLIREVEPGLYEFAVGRKASLPASILVYSLLEFWEDAAPNQETLSLERMLFDAGSPGAAFKLDDKAAIQLLESLPRSAPIRYDETAGLRTIIRNRSAGIATRNQVLEAHYPDRGNA